MIPEFPTGSVARTVVDNLPVVSDPLYIRIEVSSQEEKKICDMARDIMLKIQEQNRDMSLECLRFCRKFNALGHAGLSNYFSAVYNESVHAIYIIRKTIFSYSRNIHINNI